MPAPPVHGAADARWSVVSSAVDLAPAPDETLIDLLLSAGARARSIDLADLAARSAAEDAAWVRLWPGEHYRLLAALSAVLEPAVALEVGTYKGHGALALAAGCPSTRVITYDIVPWRDFPDTALRPADFDTGRVEQRIGDLGDAAYRDAQLETLRAADLVFVDGPKDGRWEQHALPPLLDALSDRPRIVVLDDIRLMEMLQLWRDLPFPKLDATSFGHWSGTGLLRTVTATGSA
jgi:predicted O-methyltransferase YrrM